MYIYTILMLQKKLQLCNLHMYSIVELVHDLELLLSTTPPSG